jgi:hypothetical protein
MLLLIANVMPIRLPWMRLVAMSSSSTLQPSQEGYYNKKDYHMNHIKKNCLSMMSKHILCEDVRYSIHISMLTQNSSKSRQSWKGKNLTVDQYF